MENDIKSLLFTFIIIINLYKVYSIHYIYMGGKRWQCSSETISIIVVEGDLLRFTDVHGEQNDLGSDRGHLVAEAVAVDTIAVCRERVLAVRLAITRVYHFLVGSYNLCGGRGVEVKVMR